MKTKYVVFSFIMSICFFSCTKLKNKKDLICVTDSIYSSIEFSKRKTDFGTLKLALGDTLQTEFQFKNISHDFIYIANVEGSCGCMYLDWTKNPVPPQGTGIVLVKYPHEKKGFFMKSVIVETNKSNDVTLLKICGTLK